MFQERLQIVIIKLGYGPYPNLWYLITKSIFGKYWPVNVAVELIQDIVKDVNLLLFADKFLEKFASCAISFLIDFFLAIIKLSLITNLEI